ILNLTDSFKTGWGIFVSVLRIFFLYPDVVFGKGGYASFPTLLAARLFGIPVVIHESDSVPGRVNLWVGRFAKKVALSFEDAAQYFPQEKVALTGNPVRKGVMHPSPEGAYEFLKLEREAPILLVLGGSQGAQALNEVVLSALPQLLEHYQVIHQTGGGNIEEVSGRAKVVLQGSSRAGRYHAFGYLDDLAMRMSAGVASLVISRAGSTIFEIASWGLPSILVPLPGDVAAQDHQRKNAFAYARTGACSVIEQNNLTAGVLLSETNRILTNPGTIQSMRESATRFSRGDAARTIAEALLDIAISHEK
ncbi:MAG: UDP-N-acetylglucosamine--N-acetylmuramyl-(pentapeptide) pyrophosphoryl-undecaprenol N-acetylglucosamine transferase, partial [Patescibacteria group bacterium]|nr:UDP-N-acetylglucosamine--N-acetylmuramyl-(pentapeptide) pyrophosphoryl-undecaprenol N-acetylglucosamine transferase [Patescibacteria group bacterium]